VRNAQAQRQMQGRYARQGEYAVGSCGASAGRKTRGGGKVVDMFRLGVVVGG
jgi:hypothetical protein